jgi:3-hydroxyacyl-[acyl-carrier-protein] dehydratase
MIRIIDELDPAHPVFPGHFPGNPIVPGVLLLARISRAVARASGRQVVEVPAVKFLSPLAPGDKFEIEFEEPHSATTVKFRVSRGPVLVASGALRLGADRVA